MSVRRKTGGETRPSRGIAGAMVGVALACVVLPSSTYADPDPAQDPAQVPAQWVQQLIREGRYDAAQKVLEGLDQAGVNAEVLRGSLALAQGRASQALEHFDKALAQRPQWQSLHIQRAQALMGMEQPQRVLEALAQAGEHAQTLFALRLGVRAKLDLDDVGGAVDVLQDAMARFPQEHSLALEVVRLYSEAGLYGAALDEARRLLVAGQEIDRSGLLALASWVLPGALSGVLPGVLPGGPPTTVALEVLDRIRARRPEDPKILAAVAHGYARAGLAGGAARTFALSAFYATTAQREGDPQSVASAHDSHYAAADQFRVAGKTQAALFHNSQLSGGRRRLEQRVAIYLGAGEYGRLLTLERHVEERGLWTDRLRYYFALSHYHVGDLEPAQVFLSQITSPDVLAQARGLTEVLGATPPSG